MIRRKTLILFLLLALLLTGCAGAGKNQMEALAAGLKPVACADAYRTGYEVFVYSFRDSDGDGIGDLPGVTQQLDYIAGDGGLGFDEIWLMPVFPSPTYHKYDVTDYLSIDPQYGTLEDFDALAEACRSRGVRLLLDLPVNHTSSEHPWFRAAADYLRALPEGAEPSAEDCPYLDYYNFTDTQRGGFVPLGGTKWFYEARFWSGMPDLNLRSEAVRAQIAAVTGFWLGRGADGFRLDAVTSYDTDDTAAGIEFLSWLTDTVRAQKQDAYLVGEAWTDPGTCAAYYDSGIDSLFDFQFSGNDGIICSVVRGSRSAEVYGETLAAEQALFAAHNPDYINAPFYTNHDMARSAGYYAGDDGSRVKLAGAMNLLMPGNAFVYYGEELGMKGSGRDENKRAPMYWTLDAAAEGMCRGPEQMEAFAQKFPPQDEQAQDPWSVWQYFRTCVKIRRSFPAIARGETQYLPACSSRRTVTLLRGAEDPALTPVLLVFNTDKEPAEVRLTGEAAGFRTLAAVLLTAEGTVTLKNGTLTLPPFGTAVLTQ